MTSLQSNLDSELKTFANKFIFVEESPSKEHLKPFKHLAKVINTRGESLLHQACQVNHAGVVEWLLKAGASVDLQTKEGKNTPLHIAVAYKKEGAVEKIIKKISQNGNVNSILNMKNGDGNSPLHLASNGTDEVSKRIRQKLIAAGSDPFVTTFDGKTSQEIHDHYAGQEKSLIDEKFGEFKRRFAQPTGQEEPPKEELGEFAAYATKTNSDDETLLHIAASVDQPKIIGWLVRQGAKIDHQDGNGNTPLHIATVMNRTRVVRTLCQKIQDKKVLNRQNNEGQTALHYASQNDDIYNILVEAGAKETISDHSQDTPETLRRKHQESLQKAKEEVEKEQKLALERIVTMKRRYTEVISNERLKNYIRDSVDFSARCDWIYINHFDEGKNSFFNRDTYRDLAENWGRVFDYFNPVGKFPEDFFENTDAIELLRKMKKATPDDLSPDLYPFHEEQIKRFSEHVQRRYEAVRDKEIPVSNSIRENAFERYPELAEEIFIERFKEDDVGVVRTFLISNLYPNLRVNFRINGDPLPYFAAKNNCYLTFSWLRSFYPGCEDMKSKKGESVVDYAIRTKKVLILMILDYHSDKLLGPQKYLDHYEMLDEQGKRGIFQALEQGCYEELPYILKYTPPTSEEIIELKNLMESNQDDHYRCWRWQRCLYLI